MNVKLLRKVQKFILAEPRRFDMADWIYSVSDEVSPKEKPPCGTALCIAGAVYAIEKKLKLNYTDVAVDDVRSVAVKALDLGDIHYGLLFFTDDWPAKFRMRYETAKTPLQRAKAGVARIEHFIKTNGAE